jgi:predicted GNAT family acetyltransferase
LSTEFITIRSTTSDDALRLRDIRLAALRDEPDAFGSTYEESMHYSMDRWHRMATEWNYFIAETDDQIVGMASGNVYAPHTTTAWLFGMFVQPAFRGTGLAQALVARVATWARSENYSSLGLHVTETMARARAFYEKIGFHLNGEFEVMPRKPALRLLVMTTDLVHNEHI